MIAIREEMPADEEGVFAVEQAAFGRADEARLVEALRREPGPRLSLVAEDGTALVGHVLFTPVALEGRSDVQGLAALGPLAVLPDRQRGGIGARLVREGLARCPALGWRAVFLLGDPAYYGRFGFERAASRGLHYRSEAFDPAFQVMELEEGALSGLSGWIRYLPPFESV